MRYWLDKTTQNYEFSTDDMSFVGYTEVTERPSLYPSMYKWDFERQVWVIDYDLAVKTIADRRYEVETSGVYYNNERIDTSDRGKSMLTLAGVRATGMDPAAVIDWKVENGRYIPLTAEQILFLQTAIAIFIGKTFDHERALLERCTRLDFDPAELNTGWPDAVIA